MKYKTINGERREVWEHIECTFGRCDVFTPVVYRGRVYCTEHYEEFNFLNLEIAEKIKEAQATFDLGYLREISQVYLTK